MSGSNVQRQIAGARILRTLCITAALIEVLLIAVHIASGAIVPAAVSGLIAVLFAASAVLATARIRITQRMLAQAGTGPAPAFAAPPARPLPVTAATTMADFEAGVARLSATSGSCAHPAAEPVDLITGERVAWVCPDCNAELPARWTLTATPSVSADPALSAAGSLSAPMTGPGGRWRPLSELPGMRQEDDGIPGGPLIEGMRRELEAERQRHREAKATWDDVAYASEASAHFAALARVGQEFCPSYCPICAGRLERLVRASILAVPPDLGDPVGDLRRDMQGLRDLERSRAGEFSPDDIALMRSGALFGTDASVTLPSGKRMTGNEIRQWIENDRREQR